MLVFACFSPHPPLILPTVGSLTDQAQVKLTIKALKYLASKLKETTPDLIIISSPHSDWGFNVPLHFLFPQGVDTITPLRCNTFDTSVKRVLYPLLTTSDSPEKHFQRGQKIIKMVPDKLRVAWIASGDMSHRLKEDGPYGFHPSGPKFDKEFIKLLKNKDVQGILNLPESLAEEAGECGLRSFCLLLGALEASKASWQPKVLSYEGPFGVGYLVTQFIINGWQTQGPVKNIMDKYIKLAKKTIETYIKTGKVIPLPKDLPKEMLIKKAGVFVSLHLKSGELRGCIGTFFPTKPSVAQEIIQNAISSTTQDSRFPPVMVDELPNLIYSVDILSTSKSVSKDKLSDPKKYGLIVSAQDGRRGLLLPDLPGVETIEEQIKICRMKAGINPWEPVSYQIFTVKRHQ